MQTCLSHMTERHEAVHAEEILTCQKAYDYLHVRAKEVSILAISTCCKRDYFHLDSKNTFKEYTDVFFFLDEIENSNIVSKFLYIVNFSNVAHLW